MKKLLILLFLIVLLFTSCNVFTNDRTEQLDALTSEESVKIKQMSNDIVKCFTEKDKEALKALFCEQIRNKPGFDEEIDKAFKYCKCDVYITSTIEDTASGGGSDEEGKRVSWDVRPEIPYFKILTKTESGDMKEHYYGIQYVWYIVNDEDKSLEGLHYITIERLNVDSITIGKDLS